MGSFLSKPPAAAFDSSLAAPESAVVALPFFSEPESELSLPSPELLPLSLPEDFLAAGLASLSLSLPLSLDEAAFLAAAFFFGAGLSESLESLDSCFLAACFFLGAGFFSELSLSEEESSEESFLDFLAGTDLSVDAFLAFAPLSLLLLAFDALEAFETLEPALALLAGTARAALEEELPEAASESLSLELEPAAAF